MKIQVIEFDTNKVIKEVDCHDKSERQVEKVEDGMLINMNLERYYTKIVK